MRMSLYVRAGLLALVMSMPAQAADISGLSWGEFIGSDTNPAKAANIDASNGARSLTATLTVDGFSANAEGEKTEATATFSGSFLVSQPAKLQLSKLHATVSGIVVKTAGSSIHLDLAFGPAKAAFDWTDSETKSERFTRDVDMIVPDGRMPTPFDVSAVAYVKKPGKDGAALVTVDKITIEIGEALVGQADPAIKDLTADSKKPALPVAAPALVASKN